MKAVRFIQLVIFFAGLVVFVTLSLKLPWYIAWPSCAVAGIFIGRLIVHVEKKWL